MLYRDVDKKDGSLGKWLGIGGKHEIYETSDECFIREVMEETGIELDTSMIKRRGICDFKSEKFGVERMFLYTASVQSDYYNPECNEGKLKWIDKDEILNLNMWEGDFVFLKKLLSNDSFFVTSLVYGGESGDELVEIIDDKLILTDIDSLPQEKMDVSTLKSKEEKGAIDKNLLMYVSLNENNLKHVNEPKEGIFIAETPVVIKRAIECGFEPESFLCEHRLLFDLTEYNYKDVPVYSGSSEMLCEMTGYGLTHGMLSAMYRKELPSVNELISNESVRKIAVLEDVMNPANVGAIVRSAAALSADAMIVTKGASDPLYRRAIRVSMGNIFDLPYTVVNDYSWIKELKDKDFKIVSMALSNDAVFLNDEALSGLKNEKLAICFGTESTGISDTLLHESDYIVKIPMSNNVDSLNVAAASAVAFYAFCN